MQINEKDFRKFYNKILGKYSNEFYNPLDDFFNDCGWSAVLSDRSRGKTTNVLLLGVMLNTKYGIVPHYIRRREKEDLAPKTLKDLFKTILDFDYITKITNGRWNSVEYKARRWFYCNRDENGIVEIADDFFMMCMGIDNADSYKSTYNSPHGDLIILDEFIPLKGTLYLQDEFILLLDIIKTVFRDRTACKIFCLSNVISKYSPYFNEWGCSKDVQKLESGQSFVHTTKIGTKVKVTFLSATQSKVRQLSNSKFFGFENPKLGMLNNAQWQLEMYPHPLFRVKDTNLITKSLFIFHAENLIQIEIRNSSNIGVFVVCHKSTVDVDELMQRKNIIIYTIEHKDNKHYRYKFGYTKADVKLWKLYERDKFYYSDNDVGSLVADYIFNAKRK